MTQNAARPIAHPVKTAWLAAAAVFFAVGITLILLFRVLPRPQQTDLAVGDVAPETITAPREVTYVSDILTGEAEEAAAQSVADVYDAPDASVGRRQVLTARRIMDFIATVRNDSFADFDLRLAYLNQITAIELGMETATELLTAADTQFDLVERETVDLIEEAMGGEVREGRMDQVVSQLELQVSTDVPDDLVPVVLELAGELVVPNTARNEEATEARRAEAVAAVEPVTRTYLPGQVIIRAGETVDPVDLEALEVLGLLEPAGIIWQDVAAAVLAAVLSTLVIVVYLSWRGEPLVNEPVHLTLFAVLTLLFILAAQVIIPGRDAIGYLFPIAALTMVVSGLFGLEYAIVVAVVIAGLSGYMADFSLEAAAYVGVCGVFGAGALRRNARLNAYFIAGLIAAIAGVGALLAFRLPGGLEAAEIGPLILFALLSGLLSAGGALVIILMIGNLTDITTSLQLIDLTRPDHTLQRKLQQEAIGTYHHTLAVANLAEAAAEAIGADSLLTRVGVLYHDIGKTTNPGFFIENRIEGIGDAYDNLSPLASARIIKSHVSEGVKMAKQQRLPTPVIDFIRTHHGTRAILFFLSKAREEAAQSSVPLDDESPYFYDGPKPFTPEQGIVLLADACESATRANRPTSTEEIEGIVDRIFKADIESGQLVASGLSLTDIATIRDTFIRTLKGMYHPRIKYPGDKKPAPAALPASTRSEEEDDKAQEAEDDE
ncbi:MAG: HD family phosphohydrolase [Anaerolineae bacterium]